MSKSKHTPGPCTIGGELNGPYEPHLFEDESHEKDGE